MTITKNRIILMLAAGTTVAIAIAVLLMVNASQRSDQVEPVPNIALVHDGKEYNDTLEKYYWHGSLPPPNMDLPNTLTLANVTRGDSIEFVAINASRQPDYYVISAWNATGTLDSKTLFADRRLDGNTLVVDWKEGGAYGMYVTAIWSRTDMFEQSRDSVSYRYSPIYVTE